ncbi:MAG: glycosyltransferase, partial [Candidatus Micrarchaeota archaeon]|nr:glycosyltransferase [Candidatus Micrarchaeota archaeon]
MAIIYSACIPTYRRPDEVARFLAMFDSIAKETGLKDKFELCISDNNEDLATRRVVDSYKGKLNIRYHRWGKNTGYDRNGLQSMKLATGRFFHAASDEISFTKEAFSAMMALLESTDADGVCIRPVKGVKTPAGLYRHAFSPAGVAGYYSSYMSTLIMNRKFLGMFLKFHGKKVEAYMGRLFIHLPILLYFMQNAKTMENLGFEMDFGRQGALFPSRLADVYLNHYFILLKACCENGMVKPGDYARFKRSFLLVLPFLFLKIRIYMNPKIYASEIGKVKEALDRLPAEYGAAGKAWIALWRLALFNPIIPYHLAYGPWYRYKVRVKKDSR